jgi:hypothetical protein
MYLNGDDGCTEAVIKRVLRVYGALELCPCSAIT